MTIPNGSRVKILQMLLKDSTIGAQTIKLYTNNVTPDENSTASSFTELSLFRYTPITMSRLGWTITQESGVTIATQTAQVFSFEGEVPITVYGYYIVDALSGVLLGAEKFAIPQIISNVHDEITVVPTFTLT